MKRLRISPALSLPLDAITETFAILAVRGAGKSNAAVVMAEEMFHAGLPWVAIDPKGDWWGIRSSVDGKGPGLPVALFGASGRRRKNKPEPDVPLEDTAGALIADLIVEERLPCILDMSGFSETAKIRFLIEFGTRLFERNEDPLHLFLEECDDYMPQKPFKEQTRLLHIYTKILKQGRTFGLGATLVSQRSAVVNKNALTQAGTLITMRTTSPQDREAIQGWVKEKSGSHLELMDSLPSLKNGEAWVWSPEFLKTVERITFRQRGTFDSGATPKVGEKKTQPKTVADIDLATLQKRMGETIERAKAEDPKTLKRQVRELQKALESRAPAETIKEVEVPVMSDVVVRRLTDAADRMEGLWTEGVQIHSVLEKLLPELREASHQITEAVRVAQNLSRPGAVKVQEVGAAADLSTRTRIRNTPPAAVPDQPTDINLSKAQQTIVDTLGWLEAAGFTPVRKQRLGFFAGFKQGGYFSDNVSRLSSWGLIEYPIAGYVQLTVGGKQWVSQTYNRPVTNEGLQERIYGKLTAAQKKILQHLVDIYPTGISKEELSEAVELRGGYFSDNVSRLSSMGLVRYPRKGSVQADPVCFLEEAS